MHNIEEVLYYILNKKIADEITKRENILKGLPALIERNTKVFNSSSSLVESDKSIHIKTGISGTIFLIGLVLTLVLPEVAIVPKIISLIVSFASASFGGYSLNNFFENKEKAKLANTKVTRLMEENIALSKDNTYIKERQEELSSYLNASHSNYILACLKRIVSEEILLGYVKEITYLIIQSDLEFDEIAVASNMGFISQLYDAFYMLNKSKTLSDKVIYKRIIADTRAECKKAQDEAQVLKPPSVEKPDNMVYFPIIHQLKFSGTPKPGENPISIDYYNNPKAPYPEAHLSNEDERRR